MARCLVIGANGFIGGHLVDSLVEAGHTVRAFDRFSANVVRFNDNDSVEKIVGDFLKHEDLHRALQATEYVFHFVSTTTPVAVDDNPTLDITTNVIASVKLFEECVGAGVKKVIFASTGGAIYGNHATTTPLGEDTCPRPVSPYAIGKLSIENYLRYFKVKHGLDYLALRISNPYGERQPQGRSQGVIPIFLNSIYQEKPINIFGDGTAVRDYIYVKDVARVIAHIFNKKQKREVYNLGSGEGVNLNQLIAIMQRLTGRSIVREFKAMPSTFVQHVVLDATALKQDFDVNLPATSLEEGIKKTWEYICAMGARA